MKSLRRPSLGFDTDDTRYISDLSDIIIVKTSYNSISELIEINDIFKLGRRNYKVLNNSEILESGLLILKMQVVANEPEKHVFTLNILNGDFIEVQKSTTLQLNIQVKDNDITVSPVSEIVYTSSDITKATVSDTGLVTFLSDGSVIITAKLKSDETIQDSINISIVSTQQDNYSVDITGNNYVYLNGNVTINAKVMNNGVEDTYVISEVSITLPLYLIADIIILLGRLIVIS